MKEHETLMENVVSDIDNIYTDLNWTLKWELLKIKTQEGSIRLGVIRAKKQKEYVNNLQKTIDNLNKLEDDGNQINADLKNECTKNLEKYYKEKDEGYIIRSKLKWKNEGERSTKYFYNLEKSRQNSNVIRQIKRSDGHLVESDREILQECTSFYDTLFKTRNIPQEKINEYLNDVIFESKLSEEQKKMCDEKITDKKFSMLSKI